MREKEFAILVSDKKCCNYDPLEELKQLTKTAGAETIDCLRFDFSHPTANLFIGIGQAEKLRDLCVKKNANLIIFDRELSPVQQRNLEEITQVKVIDRTQLILDIFAQHASSREGELQVELAQANYMLTRLTGKGTELSQLAGGIGTLGPGETKLEYDRRKIRKHITLLNNRLKKISLHRELQRKKRKENMVALVVLIGYTNSGKTTLINRIASSNFAQGDKLFLTLDSVMRKIDVGNNQKAILVDTVGFIRGLPHQLIASFKSTLEEVNYADILVHVIDSSSMDIEGNYKVVTDILKELNVSDKPTVTVLNKEDKLTTGEKRQLQRIFPEGIFISAANGNNIEKLKAKLSQILETKREIAKFSIPFDKMNIVSIIHEQGNIIKEEFTDSGIKIKAEIPRELSGKLAEYQTKK
ncbi:MAG: GTPase HflX [Candidatus Ratteibacteria bacterium]|nr:GTPase HflX [Candidatus Ratteibacteria bacterium]